MKTLIRFIVILLFFIPALKTLPQNDSLSRIKKLVETGTDGISCDHYKITDSYGKDVKVPHSLMEELKCPRMGILFSPDYNQVVFSSWDTLFIYDFVKDSLTIVMLMVNETQGRRFIGWTEKGSRFMFADINQKLYPKLAKLFIVDFKDGKCIQNAVIDAPFDLTCGSECFPNKNSIWFEGEDIVKYRRDEDLSEDPGKIISVNLTE